MRSAGLLIFIVLCLSTAGVFPLTADAAENGRRFLNVAVGRVRSAPSLDGEIIFKLQRGAEVEITDRRNAWHRIQTLDGRSGWAHSRLFSETPPANAAVHATPVDIDRIWVEQPAAGGESVSVALNALNTPHTFVISGEAPRIVCDFYNAQLTGEDLAGDIAGRRIVRSIRTASYGGPLPRIRLVVDLIPGTEINIDPVFDKNNMRFSLILSRGASAD